ncbi:MAG TPA: hypothetical protein VN229_23185 [Terriglobales bacterium]|nr:hypothetical protein [Terriglobales bacterium]
MMKMRSLVAAMALTSIALAWPLAGNAEQLKGTNFINVVGRNTLVGKASDGASFRVYFLPGGMVTYQDNRNKNDQGTWMLDKNGDVCVTWAHLLAGKQNCYQVNVDKSHVTWGNKDMSNQGGLVGGVASMDAKPLQ